MSSTITSEMELLWPVRIGPVRRLVIRRKLEGHAARRVVLGERLRSEVLTFGRGESLSPSLGGRSSGYGERVGNSGDEGQRLVEEARAAHREHRYDTTYRALSVAGEQGPLSREDLQLLAEAAWWLGLVRECLRLTEQLHHRHIEAGDVDRAAAQALDLSTMLSMRGEYALASGWLGRARRLWGPAGRFRSRPAGLRRPVAGRRGGAPDEAAHAAEQLRRVGERLDEDTLRALGLLGMGVVEVRRGHLSEGFGRLDEAMLPVVAGTVAPDWAGHIYCQITETCLDVADLTRAPSGRTRRTAGCTASRTQ